MAILGEKEGSHSSEVDARSQLWPSVAGREDSVSNDLFAGQAMSTANGICPCV